jgi:hypothetical protein
MNKVYAIAVFCVSFVATWVAISLAQAAYKRDWQQGRLRDAATSKLVSGDWAVTRYDWWDRPIWVEITAETSAYREAKATSAGADGHMGNKDDWSETRIDFNKSFIAGAWTAEKAGEFAKGAWDTVKRKAGQAE